MGKAPSIRRYPGLSCGVLVCTGLLLPAMFAMATAAPTPGAGDEQSGSGASTSDSSGGSGNTGGDTTDTAITTISDVDTIPADDFDDDSLSTVLTSTIFIVVWVGIGIAATVMGVAIVYENLRRRNLWKKAEAERKKEKELRKKRRSSALHELMGYDPEEVAASDLSNKEATTWAVGNNQLRLPHIVVNGVASTPVTSSAHIVRRDSQVSMSAQMFVNDWAEGTPEPTTPDSGTADHGSVMLNPVFEESESTNPGKQLSRRSSQLSMMREALASQNPDDGIEWVLDE